MNSCHIYCSLFTSTVDVIEECPSPSLDSDIVFSTSSNERRTRAIESDSDTEAPAPVKKTKSNARLLTTKIVEKDQPHSTLNIGNKRKKSYSQKYVKSWESDPAFKGWLQ